ncbi:hypothetical protein [Flavobacterium sp. MMS24-S5]|uniref:hypothetical protein n=1 Tax=Flavobacterium sp. MMS24-S5 TaxID=3416605 RepID=UPI003CFEEB63
MEVFLAHIFFAIILFLIINWIGKHSYSIGYIGITIFTKSTEAPALNFLIRVLSPIVYIIIISSILYYLGLDVFVKNIYLVNIYYLVFRLIVNLITFRGRLLNWYEQFLYWIFIIFLSYLFYEKIIKIKENILPDFTTIANELWIIILVFLFQVSNKIKFSEKGTEKRRANYLKAQYLYFNKLYGASIREITKNEILESVVFAILIYENFNRPKVIRIVENLKHKFSNKSHTLGVMQVRTDSIIDDYESVILGTSKVVFSYQKFINENKNEEEINWEWKILSKIISDYNSGYDYQNEVTDLFYQVKDLFYKDTKDRIV